jgi:hypothetical protein
MLSPRGPKILRMEIEKEPASGSSEFEEVREVNRKHRLNNQSSTWTWNGFARALAILPAGMLLLAPVARAQTNKHVAAQGKQLVAPSYAQSKARAPSSAEGEFFIISSVDLVKHQLLLKRPTEVTDVMAVTDETKYMDEQGHAIQLKDFRAGDTVYVISRNDKDGTQIAQRIQKGEMTVSLLQSRYLNGLKKY